MRWGSKTRDYTKPLYSITEGRTFENTAEMEKYAKDNGLYIKESRLNKQRTKKYAKYINGIPHVFSFEEDDWIPVKEDSDEN